MWTKLGPFINLYLGKPNIGDTGQNRGQCVGLVETWLDYLARVHIPGNAVDLLSNAPGLGYKTVANAPTNFPAPGDIVTWGPSWGGGFGHCAVVIAADDMQLVVFEENDPLGAGCLVGLHDYSGVQGWIALA
jgi:hypothetical protein